MLTPTQQAYRNYLQSEDWKKKKEEKKKKCAHVSCAICGHNQVDVHHLIYKRWTDVDTTDTRLLCRRCHYVVHLLERKGMIYPNNPKSHASIFATIKYAVKYVLGIPQTMNLSVVQEIEKDSPFTLTDERIKMFERKMVTKNLRRLSTCPQRAKREWINKVQYSLF